jgi:hypothetical protein
MPLFIAIARQWFIHPSRHVNEDYNSRGILRSNQLDQSKGDRDENRDYLPGSPSNVV